MQSALRAVRPCCLLLALVVCWLTVSAQSIVLDANMKTLGCAGPDKLNRFLGSNAPGHLFLPGEAVNITLALSKDTGPFALEVQEITTRDPDKRDPSMQGYTDTGGHALLIGLEGKPIAVPLAVTFTDKPEETIAVPNVPVPARFGTYALVLVHGAARQFLGTVARVPKPREGGTLENTPIFGEGAFLGGNLDERLAIYQRMGIHGSRIEATWSEREDGTPNWTSLDKLMDAAQTHDLQFMVTLGGMGGWQWPFKKFQTPGAVGEKWKNDPYSGQCDWMCGPDLYPRYGKWITAFTERYWKGGKGALWGFENYNEPWEGGGISGWARDMLQYRELQKLIATSAHQVDPRVRICGACSIMNTEDKLFSDGGKEFDQYIDVFTDHYVVPPMCYGPMVAHAHGKQSMETETWVVNSEYSLPQVMCQFLASGQDRVAPWHPRVLFDDLKGVKGAIIPSPTVVATAAFNHFVTGKPFEKLVFKDHLPWVFQFGKDTDKDGLLVVFGQLLGSFTSDPGNFLWAQVNSAPGGTLTIDNHDGLLKFYDLAGNPMYEKQQTVTLPMTIFPAYIQCAKGPAAAAARLASAKMTGKRPVEIIPHDFVSGVGPGTVLRVDVHNCLNAPLTGKLAVKTPDGMTLQTTELPVKLAAGETGTLNFTLATGTPNDANAYPFSYAFTSPAGNADYSEVMNAVYAPKRTITVDGNLDDWKGIPSITVVGGKAQVEMSELMRRPWLELTHDLPTNNILSFQVAWDENYLYMAARVYDSTPTEPRPRMEGRDENKYFHSAADDTKEPFKSFLAKYAPEHSFGEVPYVWAQNPESPRDLTLPVVPFRRDRLQIGLDVTPGYHDMQDDSAKVPWGFHAVPDTDYEYSLYTCTDGSELWRQMAPGVPRIADWPRQPRGARTTGPVPGAKYVAKLDGNVYTYELALPKSELADLSLRPGATFGLAVRGGDNKNVHADYGTGKAVCKLNGLTLHPYWETSPSAAIRWTLAP